MLIAYVSSYSTSTSNVWSTIGWIIIAIYVGLGFLCAWYCSQTAVRKGRNLVGWSVLGFVYTIAAVLIITFLPHEGSETKLL
jgi:hypothetical protein